MATDVCLLYLFLIFITYNSMCFTDCLSVSGDFRETDYFNVIAKFAGQRLDLSGTTRASSKSFYILGNATVSGIDTNSEEYSSQEKLFTLVVVEKSLFLDLYGNKSNGNKHDSCQSMMSNIGKQSINFAAFNACESGTEDLLRTLPCAKNGCCDEPAGNAVVPEFQFTLKKDNHEPKYFFIALVACVRENDTCQWKRTKNKNAILNYNLQMVNGNPFSSRHNMFEYQFSYDYQKLMEIYLAFFACYAILVPMQIYAACHQSHKLTKLFTIGLCLEPIGIFMNIIHYVLFAFNGVGVEPLAITGDFIDILSESVFMLVLLLLAKGWPITRSEISWKPVLFCIWLLYTCIHFILHVWKLTEIDIIDEIDEYQTLPGWLIIGFRIIIMAWFFIELRNTMISENDACKLQFYLHFGAGILIYFIYLPVVVLIALHVSPMIRQKLLLGMTCGSDFLAFAVTTNLLWPTRTEQYFQLASVADLSDELEELNEAPHNQNSSPLKKVSC